MKATCIAYAKLALALLIFFLGIYGLYNEVSYISNRRRGRFEVAFPVQTATVTSTGAVETVYKLTSVHSYDENWASWKCSVLHDKAFHDEASAQKAAQWMNNNKSYQEELLLIPRGAAECDVDSIFRAVLGLFILLLSFIAALFGLAMICAAYDQTRT